MIMKRGLYIDFYSGHSPQELTQLEGAVILTHPGNIAREPMGVVETPELKIRYSVTLWGPEVLKLPAVRVEHTGKEK
jgi:hypothetical protein